VRLAQGDAAVAAASIREALEHPVNVPSKELPSNTELRRAPLLEAAVEIEIAVGHLDRARSAADELTQVAARFESKALAASAALAQGRVRSAAGDTQDAKRHFDEAARLWQEVGAPYETALARRLRDALRVVALESRAPRTEAPPPGLNAFRREGDYWSVTFEGCTVRVKELKGMHYLQRLLADPGRELHVLDLVALESRGNAPVGGAEPEVMSFGLGDAGAMLDPRAKEAYRRRLAEIEEDIEEAQAIMDLGRATQASAERDFLVRELSRAVGLGGRDRTAGSASERARASVTRAVRQALTRIRQHHPLLGKHLDHAIHTGTYCAYQPDPRVPLSWGF